MARGLSLTENAISQLMMRMFCRAITSASENLNKAEFIEKIIMHINM